MKRFLSLSSKVMISMITLVLVISIIVGSLLLYKSEQQNTQEYRELQLRSQARYNLLVDLLSERLSVWLETLAFFRVDDFKDKQTLVSTLDAGLQFLQLHWEVKGLWLVDENDDIIYGNQSVKPNGFFSWVTRTRQQLSPLSEIHCESECEHLLTVPIMANNGDLYTIVTTSSMQELLALLSESAAARLVMVKRILSDIDGAPKLKINSTLVPTSQQYFTALLAQLPANVAIEELVTSGVLMTLKNQQILVTLLPMEGEDSQGNYILFVHDIGAKMEAYRAYQYVIVGGALVAILIFCVGIYVLLRGYGDRLVRLSLHLPLLSQHKFDEFKAQRAPKRGLMFADELDVLEHSANDLAVKLQTLDEQVELNTQKLEKMAMFDSLTGLPNRNMLTFHINKILAQMTRKSNRLALMFIDLDDFKKVNDSHGHGLGDELLKMAAKRLSASIRDSDLAARFGGDEFVIVIENITDTQQVECVAHKLISEFTAPLVIDEFSFYMTISIGIAITDSSDSTSIELLRHADTAMYEAKNAHGSAFSMYDTRMNQKVMRKVELESEARIALHEDQFYLALQPQLELKTRRLIGFEALLRWEHPTKGLIPPDDFIPLLENSPFMLQLDYWVIARSFRILKELEMNGFHDVKIAMNLSAAQFLDPSLCDYLQSQLEMHGVDPHNVELELTETTLVADLNRAISVMKNIRELGCMIAVDDFGTGYSSLSYLKSMPTDLVKIDKSFVSGMINSANDRNIVYSTISMVRSMGMNIIAEGIETPAQYELLSHFNCHFGQGYLISKPINEMVFWKVLEEKVKNGYWIDDMSVFNEPVDPSATPKSL
jgi:diguanylate cyclase (GGDEF)-like protein